MWFTAGFQYVLADLHYESNFCVHQMLMRDGMHVIDLGIIITLIRAILRTFMRLWWSFLTYKEELLQNQKWCCGMLLHAELDWTDKGICTICIYMHAYAFICNHTLYLQLQGNAWLFSPCGAVFGRVIQAFVYQEQASAKGEGYGYASYTTDPSLFPGPHRGGHCPQVKEHNRKIPVARIVDPSPMMVEITIMLLWWYHLYRRNFLQRMKKISRTWAPLERC